MVVRRVCLFIGVVLFGLLNACADSAKEQKERKAESSSKAASLGKANAQSSVVSTPSNKQSTTSKKTVNIPKQERVIQFTPPRIVQYDDEYPHIAEQVKDTDWSEKMQSGTDGYYDNVEAPPMPEIRTEENVLDFVDEQAQFPGGMEAMREYLKKNMMYPAIAKESGIQGKCYIRFIVNTDGSISDVKVLRGVIDCPQCDREALRVVKNMPKWAPGKINGKAVRMNYTLPIVFKLS